MSMDPVNRPPRILQVHNEYFSGRGGEDTVVSLELAMLRKNGHEVDQLIISTAELQDANPLRILAAGISTPWSIRGYRLVQRAIKRFRPDVVHCHNTFPLLSPSIYWAAHEANAPVVQTLHNYRFVCANGLISRDDLPCEECLGRLPLPALRYKCCKNSFFATAPLVAMQTIHQLLGTAHRKVDAFITLTSFAKAKMIQAGFPAEKIYVKPNFEPERVHAIREPSAIRQFAFLGKVIRYKGLDLLLDAWNKLDHPGGRLVIAGEGPSKPDLEHRFPNSDRIIWLGWQDRQDAMSIIDQSDFLVLPSRVVEGLPMVLVEGLSAGTPSIAPNHGAFPQLVSDGYDGILFEPRDVHSLTEALRRTLSLGNTEWREMSERCIKKYQKFYTEETNYRLLCNIYTEAIRRRIKKDVPTLQKASDHPRTAL